MTCSVEGCGEVGRERVLTKTLLGREVRAVHRLCDGHAARAERELAYRVEVAR